LRMETAPHPLPRMTTRVLAASAAPRRPEGVAAAVLAFASAARGAVGGGGAAVGGAGDAPAAAAVAARCAAACRGMVAAAQAVRRGAGAVGQVAVRCWRRWEAPQRVDAWVMVAISWGRSLSLW
jgi:hypothetical protein